MDLERWYQGGFSVVTAHGLDFHADFDGGLKPTSNPNGNGNGNGNGKCKYRGS
ncbi:hypothetical protein [Granulicella tundricola]|uniref:hypothetical protein n=1 Tax=Granulicella tundricola TaxID=940615 RepID=UPI0002DF2EC7|nr:hypothetical protein [Granulicella tundricola]